MADHLKQFISDTLILAEPSREENELQLVVSKLEERFGDKIIAVLLYGSYLRGARDTLIDFYVIVDNYKKLFDSDLESVGALMMPPNVYYLDVNTGDTIVRAKYSVISAGKLLKQVGSFHPYFWARMVQPSRLVLLRERSDQKMIVDIVGRAAETFIKRIIPMVPGIYNPDLFWNTGFSLTYKAELRAESSSKISSIFSYDPQYYSKILALVMETGRFAINRTADELRYTSNRKKRSLRASVFWVWTIFFGKALSLVRLVKGALTFEDAVDYILWKIERHSGIKVEATDRQRRYPLLFAWPLLWKLLRLRAFR